MFLLGLRGSKTIQKLFSSIVFLYFACLLPAIAFGVLNDDNTNGSISEFPSLYIGFLLLVEKEYLYLNRLPSLIISYQAFYVRKRQK